MANCRNQYITFGISEYQPTDPKYQREKVYESEYFFAEVKKVIGKDMEVRKLGHDSNEKSETYFVSGKWQSGGATKNDIVVFQRSDREYDGRKYGRVALKLGSGPNLDRVGNSVHIAQEVTAFLIRRDDSKMDPYSALSIMHCNCKAHGADCKEIGIHVSCVAWDLDKRVTKIQNNWRYQQQAVSKVLGQDNESLEKCGPFRKGSKFLAISVFVHSSDPKNTSEPTLAPVRISEEFLYSEFSTTNDLKLLWDVFKADNNNKMLTGKNHWYYTHEADTYKAHIIADETLATLRNSVKEYFKKHDLPAVLFFKPPMPSTTKICNLIEGKDTDEDRYLLLGEHLDRAKIEAETKNGSCGMRGIVTSIKIMSFPETREEIFGHSKFENDVKSGENFKDFQIVDIYPHSTGAIANQQTLLNAMLDSDKLYDEDDLLGITVRRFPAPILVKSLLRKIDDHESIEMNYIDLHRCNNVLYKIPLRDGGFNAEKERVGEKTILRWANFKCDEVVYDTVYSVSREDLKNCLQDLKNNSKRKSPLEIVVSEQPSPYQHSQSGLLTLDLIPRALIRLQICDVAPNHPQQIGHRILPVGRNGHICLSHLNKPEITFASGRHDLVHLVSQERLQAVRSVLATNKIKPTEGEKTIFWKGRYNAGGRFKTEEELKTGDFLCIRKDMYDGNGVAYVWNAHAVVIEEEGEDSEVVFATCTLMQPGEMDETSGFVIEYIKMSPP